MAKDVSVQLSFMYDVEHVCSAVKAGTYCRSFRFAESLKALKCSHGLVHESRQSQTVLSFTHTCRGPSQTPAVRRRGGNSDCSLGLNVTMP